MRVTKKYIQKLRETSFVDISTEEEKQILKRFGNVISDDSKYTEQNIWEQIRKIIR